MIVRARLRRPAALSGACLLNTAERLATTNISLRRTRSMAAARLPTSRLAAKTCRETSGNVLTLS